MSRLNKKIYKAKKKAYVHVHPVPENIRNQTHGNHQKLTPPLHICRPLLDDPAPLALHRMTASNSPERWPWWSPW